MDRAALINRIQEIEQEMNGYKASFARLEGHLAEANYWLNHMGSGEKNDGIDNDEGAQ